MRNLFIRLPHALLLAVLMLASPARDARAQQTSGAAAGGSEQTISFDEALRLALERNLGLRQSGNDVELSAATLAQERAAFLPDLNLSVGPSVRFGRSFDQTTAGLTEERSEALSVSASSSINLFNGFADVASARSARRGLAASENSFERTRHSVLYQTAAQYFQVFLNQELIEVERENLAAQRQQLETIQANHEAGNRPRADVLQQEASIAQTEQQLIAAEREYALSRLELKQTLHLSPTADVAFEPPPDDLTDDGDAAYDAAALVHTALADREDLRAQRLRIEAAEQEIRVARAGYYPSVWLNANTGTSYSSQNAQFGFDDQLTDLNPNGSVGLSVSIPVFDRLQTRASVTRAEVSADNERLQLELLEQDVAFEVEQALLDYRAAQASLSAAERQLEAAEEALRAAEARYEVGAATLLEVTEARSVYVEAATGRAEARYNVYVSHLAIAFYAGDVEQALASF